MSPEDEKLAEIIFGKGWQIRKHVCHGEAYSLEVTSMVNPEDETDWEIVSTERLPRKGARV